MAEPVSQHIGQPATDEQPLQQPNDAVQMKEMTKEEEVRTGAEADASLPLPAKDNSETDKPAAHGLETATTDPSKGKERDGQQAPAAKQEDDLVIGPTDPLPDTTDSSDSAICNITLLLPSGARHPYKIDERYLAKRNVDVPDMTEAGKKDPFSISVYTLKELILREWREEWEQKPTSPSNIRLIHFGKLLDDKEQLKKYHFSAESPNVVHMSVRPAEMMEEDEAAKGKSSGREGQNRDNSSRCCVIL